MIPAERARDENVPILGTTEARRELPRLVNSAFLDGQTYYISKRSIPLAVLMGLPQYREMLEYMDDLDAALEAREDLAEGMTVSLEDLDAE